MMVFTPEKPLRKFKAIFKSGHEARICWFTKKTNTRTQSLLLKARLKNRGEAVWIGLKRQVNG
jgi:hypothetical protein